MVGVRVDGALVTRVMGVLVRAMTLVGIIGKFGVTGMGVVKGGNSVEAGASVANSSGVVVTRTGSVPMSAY